MLRMACALGVRCSPPAWGWSDVARGSEGGSRVLPTRVGMVRVGSVDRGSPFSAPHPRGDGPGSGTSAWKRSGCSPPAWGWSVFPATRIDALHVLPTRVGMVRAISPLAVLERSAPHPRGDGPHLAIMNGWLRSCSPPAWGWSAGGAAGGVSLSVLPTRVGMVRRWRALRRRAPCAPHPRGDGPALRVHPAQRPTCSPPAWGWSEVV